MRSRVPRKLIEALDNHRDYSSADTLMIGTYASDHPLGNVRTDGPTSAVERTALIGLLGVRDATGVLPQRHLAEVAGFSAARESRS